MRNIFEKYFDGAIKIPLVILFGMVSVTRNSKYINHSI